MRLLLTLMLLLFPACGAWRTPVPPPAPLETPAPEPPPPPPPEYVGPVLAAMDRAADPCVDFYRYACGGWLDANTIPPDQARWSRSFSEIAERNREVLRGILEAAAEAPAEDGDAERLGAFWNACMDEEGAEARGVAPLHGLLDEIARVKDVKGAMRVVGRLHRAGTPALFRLSPVGDFKDPDVYLAYLAQGGLGLPDRSYYLDEGERAEGLRRDYAAHVARILSLAGSQAAEAEADAAAARILAFETEMARSQKPRAALRDPKATYNKLDLEGLEKIAPKVPWRSFLEGAGHGGITSVNVQVPEHVEALGRLLPKTDPGTVRDYLRWHLLRANARLLSSPFVEESFAFYGKRLAGQKALEPRWKRCVELADDALGEALGREFVKLRFSGESKPVAEGMLSRIEEAFARNLDAIPWMDAETKRRALEKMEAVGRKIGHPDRWRDYGALGMREDDLVGNVLAARAFEYDRRMRRVGRPVAKDEWGMTPPTVNAYYSPVLNEMVFPAGILQPPFFDATFPMAMNFGGIGMVMGHELSHGFDDSGRRFDPTGRLAEWWSPEAGRGYEERAACVSDLYATYEPQPGLRLDGRLTLGENIADLGGVRLAHGAWRLWAEAEGGESPEVPDLTPDQLFFVGFAQTWCALQTPEVERLRVATDPHSPPRFRVNGPLSNFEGFAEAFSCPIGSPMRPERTCRVW